MENPKYRRCLPQLNDEYLLTDGGLETTMIFHYGLDLPLFAAFTLLRSDWGQTALRLYYESYIKVARSQNLGLILDSPTWRASERWGSQLGYSQQDLVKANQQSIEMLFELREAFEDDRPFVVSGNVGPYGDGYAPDELLDPQDAADYHSAQIETFAHAGVDMISAITMTHTGEAIGINRACARRGVPLVLSFTVETDGRLPSGQSLGDAIDEVDADLSRGPAYYMINCAHPDHFRPVLESNEKWRSRIGGLRTNASRKSHAELDEAETLDEGNPLELAQQHKELMAYLPKLRVFGGCCGTDHRHVGAIGRVCLGKSSELIGLKAS
ncbi:MAG: homocysteine S-methyltransferase family protein [Pseudomonadota bacterium]